MMKRLILIGALLMTACGAPALREASSANAQVKVGVLTEFDGIRIYRVHDGDEHVIYVAAHIDSLRTMWLERCGKNCVREVEVATLESSR